MNDAVLIDLGRTTTASGLLAVDNTSDRSSTGAVEYNSSPNSSIASPSPIQGTAINQITNELKDLNKAMKTLNEEILRLNHKVTNVEHILIILGVSCLIMFDYSLSRREESWKEKLSVCVSAGSKEHRF